MEIKTIYKVKDREFNSKKEAKDYLDNDLKKDELRNKIDKICIEIGDAIDFLQPFFNENKTKDHLKDRDLNRLDNLLHVLRMDLHSFKLFRRELLGVEEYN